MLTKPKKIPISAGVYIFRRDKIPLYIGKAANLKKRLASYFQKNAQLPIKIQKMLQEATRLKTIETASEVEALIKEAELIKKYRPKYNLLMRDDKSYFYVAVGREEFPRIFVTHQPRQIRNPKSEIRNKSKIQNSKRVSKFGFRASSFRYIGPFTSGSALRAALKLLRRVFPYCTCTQAHKRPCLNSEIGRCLGYCCTAVASSRQLPAASTQRREYRKNIRSIVAILEGGRTRLMGRLKREMKEAVKRERYEEAGRLRDALFGLEDVFRHRQVLHAPETTRYPWPIVLGKLQSLLKTKGEISRIEGYDISNISGTEATGSMVVISNGQPDRSQYRKFRIRTPAPPGGGNDVAMLKEVIRRRLNHPEWPYPEMMVIDGGKPQRNAALSVLRTLATSHQQPTPRKARSRLEAGSWKLEATLVTALAKREEILYTTAGRAIPLKKQDPALLHLFQRIRDESHRFARAYHRKLRQKYFMRA